MSDTILEFAQAYHSTYQAKFYDNANKLFDSLITASGVDILENRQHAKDYRIAQKAVDKLTKHANGLKVGRGFSIFGIVVGALAIVACIILMITRANNGQSATPTTAEIIIMAVGAVLIVGLSLLIKFKLNPTLANVNDQLIEKQSHANHLYSICIEELSPLYSKFKIEHTYRLCRETLPQIELDRNFSVKRFCHLQARYGLKDNLAENESTVGVFSGAILGNPFVEERRFIQSWGTHTYTGSLVISWTDVVYDSKGNSRMVTRTQTLYASVTKPKPYYYQKTTMIFGSDAAPDLSFSHEPTHCERWSESEFKRNVRRGNKEIERQAEKSVTSGGTFTEFANEEFDVIFNATDRDHEVQFRLMFTPLAQKNLMYLMRNPTPYGDDFYFQKRKKLNYVSSEHAQVWDFDPTVDRYISYDVDLCRQYFLNYNCDFFCNLYFELAPIMSVPLYQQTKSEEYIYGNEYKRNFTAYEAECLVNTINKMSLMPDDCQTEIVLKTQLMAKQGNIDRLTVTAHGFTTVEHVEYVSTLGGDGSFHYVPVYWLEYVPVVKNSVVDLYDGDEDQQKAQPNTIFKHGILARLLNL